MTDKHLGHAHRWRFFRAGGFDQVRLDRGADVAALASLDQKLWVALACPTRGIEFDEATLDLIDADHDGRIRAPELLAAAAWVTASLGSPEELVRAGDYLPIAAIDADGETGARLVASAKVVLGMLGKPEADVITLDDIRTIGSALDAAPFNGDGVVPEMAADDLDLRAILRDVIACCGTGTDRGGGRGAVQDDIDRFFSNAKALVAWHDEPAADPAMAGTIGDTAEPAAAAFAALAPKLDDFFARCRLAAVDPSAKSALGPPAETYALVTSAPLDLARAELRALPLARIAAAGELKLDGPINPSWADEMTQFRRLIAGPLLGDRDRLTEPGWRGLKARLAPLAAWHGRKPATAVEPLGLNRLKTILAGDAEERLAALVARDMALAPEVAAIAHVERLIRYRRDLLPLLNNVVSFRDFYTHAGKAVFQAGTLYIDGRSCDLCIKIADESTHAILAAASRIYLAYCQCTRLGESGPEIMKIAAAVTAGGSDNLRVGRNGLFYDRKGRDWDATIIKIIEHPISLRQAFFLPYQQAAKAIGDTIQKVAAARAAARQTQLTAQLTPAGAPAADAAAEAAAARARSQEQAFDAARFAGILAAISLALGAVATAIASIVTGFFKLAWWQMPLVFVGVVLLISGPSLVIAAIKLRSRNLGPILDASGWAVNTRLTVNIPFGASLTALPRLPVGAQRSLSDPYAERRRPWLRYLMVLAALAAAVAAWDLGLLKR